MAEHFIIDFDGTLTNTELEAKPCVDAFPDILSQKISQPRIVIDALAARFSAQVAQDPTSGWMNDGKIVAPAVVDPYVFATTVYGKVYEELCGSQGRDATLADVFKEAYPKSTTAFHPGADGFLRELSDQYEAVIVTNSATDAVQRKQEQLLGRGCLLQCVRVLGNAKKYVIDDTWDAIPETITLKDAPRPTFLRRKKYADVIASLNWDPAQTTVIGDVYELDLAMPEQLGYKTIHLVNERTPQWELTHEAAGRYVAHGYDDALRHIFGMRIKSLG